VAERRIRSVIEFGCGDGNQLGLMRYPSYLGLDIEPCAAADADPPRDYIDQLVRTAGSGVPVGFVRRDGIYCNKPTGTWQITGNVVIDCGNFRVGTDTVVEFTGGNVIFTGDITLSGNGVVRFNTANPNADPRTVQYAISPLYGERGFPTVCGELKATPTPSPEPDDDDDDDDKDRDRRPPGGGGGGGNRPGPSPSPPDD
jgi:hypothetical protein